MPTAARAAAVAVAIAVEATLATALAAFTAAAAVDIARYTRPSLALIAPGPGWLQHYPKCARPAAAVAVAVAAVVAPLWLP